MLVADRFDWWRFADDHRSPLRSGGIGFRRGRAPPCDLIIFGALGKFGISVAEILYAKVLTILQFACKIKQK